MSGKTLLKCPLADPDIGIVTENDHKVGLCLCRFCICAKHKCRFSQPIDYRAKSAWATRYQREYTPKPIRNVVKVAPVSERRPVHKLEGVTTNELTYTQFKLQSRRAVSEERPGIQQKLVGSTSYSKDYVHWGTPQQVVEKRCHLPYRSCGVPVNAKTAYKESFPAYSGNHTRNPVCNLTTILIGANTTQDTNVSTYARTMQLPTKHQVQTSVQMKESEYQIGIKVAGHFKTTTKESFQRPQQAVKDPRLLRTVFNNLK